MITNILTMLWHPFPIFIIGLIIGMMVVCWFNTPEEY